MQAETKKGGAVMMVQATVKELRDTFSEWDRRYREDPDKFMSEAAHLLKETPETYGDACAPYFMKVLIEIQMKGGAE